MTIRYDLIHVQVPADILGQLRFLNETNRTGRKGSKAKQVKKLFAKPKTALKICQYIATGVT